MNEPDPRRYAPAFTPGMPPMPSSMAVTNDGVVTSDTACRKCGYNLRGMPTDGRCPECGIAVAMSLQGDLLRFSEPDWLGNLRRGVNLILAGIALIVIMVIGEIAITMRGTSPLMVQSMATIGGLFAGLLMIGGAWLLTAPDPSGVGEDKYGTSRKIIRVALLVGLGNHVLNVANIAIHPDEGIAMMFQLAAIVASIIGLVGQAAQLQYISKLALRIPDMKLSARARFLMWAIAIDYGIILVMTLITAAVVRGLGRGGASPVRLSGLGCFTGVGGLGLLIFGVMYLLMLEKLGKRFKEQAVFARQNWAANATLGGHPDDVGT